MPTDTPTSIHEACACGAQIELVAVNINTARIIVADWRTTHRHDMPASAPFTFPFVMPPPTLDPEEL